MLIPAIQKNETLRNDINMANPLSGVAIWWLGQSGFFIKSPQASVLMDPYLSDSLTQKYQETPRPHVRMTELCISPAQLPVVHILTSSHNHTDHLDAETLNSIRGSNHAVEMIIPEANRSFVAQRLESPVGWPIGLNDGESCEVRGIRFHGIAAAHNHVDRDSHGRSKNLGYVVDFGSIRLYHSGDTMLFPGMEELLRPFEVDIALLPINGDRPERGVAGNLRGDEAAQLAHAISARLVVPCHYDMFAFNTESPGLFESSCESIGQAYRILRCGERLDIVPRG